MWPENPFWNAIIVDRTWTQYGYVIFQSGTVWKIFTYNFSAQGNMDTIFHSSISPLQSDAGDIFQEIVKKSNRIRWGYSVKNYFILPA